jgi:hypothetical protein
VERAFIDRSGPQRKYEDHQINAWITLISASLRTEGPVHLPYRTLEERTTETLEFTHTAEGLPSDIAGPLEASMKMEECAARKQER